MPAEHQAPGLRVKSIRIDQAVFARQVAQRPLGAGAEMLDHLGGGERAETAAGPVVGAARKTGQEPGREQIAGAGRVDDRSTGKACTASVPSRPITRQPFSLRVTTARTDVGAQGRDRRVEVGGLIKTAQLGLVGEDQIHGA